MAPRLILSLQEAYVRYADKVIFDALDVHITAYDKICLIGNNGAGKSTLMKLITGERELDGGIAWQLPGLTIGSLPQEIIFSETETVGDFVFKGLHDENQADFHDYKVEKILHPLQLSEHEFLHSLSGGQLRRVALARALVEEPDLLLLDEPTNHLDLEGITWLENYIKNYRGAVLCISHDRAFLSAISNKVFWLDRGQLRVCPKGFSFFEEWQTQILEYEERALENRQKLLEQELDWASRGVKARRKRNIRRLQLVHEERERLKNDQGAFRKAFAKVTLTPLNDDTGTSKSVAEFYNVTKNYDDKIILDKFHFRIQRGDRIGLLGKNGSGKTTFIKMLLGEVTPDSGTIKRARDLQFSYFDQKRRDLVLTDSLWKTLSPQGGEYIDVMGKQRHVCGYLKDFLFDPSTAHQPISTLSGGQKNRLLLARILANPGSFLILDEPTNDLDMETLDRLEEILSQYKGTLLVVSHDRDFLDQTVTKVLAFEGDGKIDGVIGGYSDYLALKQNEQAELIQRNDKVKEEKNIQPSPSNKATKKLSYALNYELNNLPEKIEKLTHQKQSIETELAQDDLYKRNPDRFHHLVKELSSVKEELDKSELRWLELDILQSETL